MIVNQLIVFTIINEIITNFWIASLNKSSPLPPSEGGEFGISHFTFHT